MSQGTEGEKSLAYERYDLIAKVAFLVCIITSLFVGFVAYQTYASTTNIRKIDRSLERLDRLQKLLVDLETGARGFWLTDENQKFLQPYYEALSLIDEKNLIPVTSWLGGIYIDEPTVEEFNTDIKKWIEVNKTEINGSDAPQLEDLLEGKNNLDSIRDRKFKMAEKLREELREERNGLEINFWLMLLSIVFLVSIVSLVPIFTAKSRKFIESEYRKLLNATKEAGDAKLNFLSNMSHEIRTPISAIMNYSEVGSQLNEDITSARLYFVQIKKSSLHLMELVNDILDFSKIRSKSLEIKKEPIIVKDFVGDLLSISGQQISAEHKDLRLELDLSAELPEVIFSDRLKLRQVLINLISNAMKYSPGNKTVKLKIQISDRDVGTMCFSVEDQGSGISDSDKVKIFNTFEQLSEGDDRLHQGTGLGLAISQAIVNKMGSEIKVSDNNPSGCIFSLDIHCYDPQSASLKAINIEQSLDIGSYLSKVQNLKNKVILLVDDRQESLASTKLILQQIGTTVVDFVDPSSAYDFIQTGEIKFDLGLLDLQMPKIDGFQLAKMIRDIGVSVPLVAISASTSSFIRKKALVTGFEAFIPKPTDAKTTVSTISNVLERHSDSSRNEKVPNNSNILLIDDSEEFASLFSKLLTLKGSNHQLQHIDPTKEPDIQTIVAKIKNWNCELAIVDHNVGTIDYNYFELLGYLKDNLKIPLVGLTAYESDEVSKEFQDSVEKIFSKSEINAVISYLLDH